MGEQLTSTGTCTSEISHILGDIAANGINRFNLGPLEQVLSRQVTAAEITSPALLFAKLGERDDKLVDWEHLFTSIGSRINTDPQFYFKTCPREVLFLAQSREEGLAGAVEESIKNLNKSRLYVPGMAIETITPSAYRRLENIERPRLEDETETGSRVYITKIDLFDLSYQQAKAGLKDFYCFLDPDRIEVHNNRSRVHNRVNNVEVASTAALNGSIVKLDSPDVNVYLKPNASYHLRIDIKGTKNKIKEMAYLIEEVLMGVLADE